MPKEPGLTEPLLYDTRPVPNRLETAEIVIVVVTPLFDRLVDEVGTKLAFTLLLWNVDANWLLLFSADVLETVPLCAGVRVDSTPAVLTADTQ